MARSTPDDLALTPLDGVAGEAVAHLVEVHGVSRYLMELPNGSGSPSDYLTSRILEDAALDDSVGVAALRDGEVVGLLVLRYPQWDRGHFGYAVGRVEHLQGADEQVLECLVGETVRRMKEQCVRMCSARLSSDALGALNRLERWRFRYVEQTLSPWRDLSTWVPMGFGVTRPTRAEDIERTCAIARTAFRTDRFHRDMRFDRAAADGVYEQWVRSWHADPSPGHYSRVLILDGAVAGFFMFELLAPLEEGAHTVARVVLNAIDASVAGHGHGFRMYCDALDVASEAARYATAVVAAANPAVVNLYEKLGFRLTSSGEVTMHWWSED